MGVMIAGITPSNSGTSFSSDSDQNAHGIVPPELLLALISSSSLLAIPSHG
jgi:hypothetical protein